jgi:1-aminocyclopropane-1-carboxylate deaminase/D-cysteine desulfhydrase-like pyridoxal-dependent ACC family enzyme
LPKSKANLQASGSKTSGLDKPPTRAVSVTDLHLPTPFEPLPLLVDEGMDALWIKNDGPTGSIYGGNKLRKLSWALAADRIGARQRVVTFGAAGSHHVLATTLHARAQGLDVIALLAPQRHTPHAARIFRCTLGQGANVVPLNALSAAKVFAQNRDALWLGPGALGPTGSWGYALAAHELKSQVTALSLQEPAHIVLAVGTGGTAAGLLVGLEQCQMNTRVIGVLSAPNRWARALILAQAAQLARLRGVRCSLAALSARLELDASQAATGYGVPSSEGERAARLARDAGLVVDPTYTAKALAVALEVRRQRRSFTVYWHTLSSRDLQPLLSSAPEWKDIPARLRALLPAS